MSAAVILVSVSVGLGLAMLILRLQSRLDSRIDGLDTRLYRVEKSQARLEGLIAGIGHPLSRVAQPPQPESF